MAAPAYDRDDPTFVDDLKHSDAAVIRTGLWFRRQLGKHVYFPPLRIRPTSEEMADYSDGGDLFISDDGEVWKRIEVTVRGFPFKCRKDFPYPTIIVEAVHRYEAANPKPAGYVRLSSTLTHAAMIGAETRASWIETCRRDVAKKRDRRFLECPMEFVKIVETKGL
jgi:hypothetical protein